MKFVPLTLVLLLCACGAAPAPIHYPDLEEIDRRFALPSPPDTKSALGEILKKDELTLEDVLRIADMMNPELASERKNIDLATAAIWEARLYPNPSIFVELEEYATNDGATIGKTERMAGVSFPIVVSGRIGAATSVTEKEREVAALNYVWRRRQILGRVKRAFIGVLAARRKAELAKETRDLAKSLHDLTDERFKAQAIPEMEVLKAAVNLAKSGSDLRLAERDLAVSVKNVHALMGDVDFPKERFLGDLFSKFTAPSLEVLRGQVVTAHPLLQVAMKRKEAAELQLSLARAERIPDPVLELGAGRGADDDTILEVGISIPLPIFNRNQAKISAANIRIRQSELEIHSARNEVVLQLTEVYLNFTAAQDRVTVYQDEILPKARKALDQTNEGYRQGKFTYLDVLDAQRSLAEARTAYAAALADLNLSASEVEKLTGTKLEPIR